MNERKTERDKRERQTDRHREERMRQTDRGKQRNSERDREIRE